MILRSERSSSEPRLQIYFHTDGILIFNNTTLVTISHHLLKITVITIGVVRSYVCIIHVLITQLSI